MIAREEFQKLDHKLIPISERFDTQFIYGGITYTMGKIEYNDIMGSLVTSIKWRIGSTEYSANGIAIQTGINIVAQYDTKLPALVAANINDRGANVKNISDLRMYVIQEFDKYFLGK